MELTEFSGGQRDCSEQALLDGVALVEELLIVNLCDKEPSQWDHARKGPRADRSAQGISSLFQQWPVLNNTLFIKEEKFHVLFFPFPMEMQVSVYFQR